MTHPLVSNYDLELKRFADAADGMLKGIIKMKKKGVKDNELAMMQTVDGYNKACQKRDEMRAKREELLGDLVQLDRLQAMLGSMLSWKCQLEGDAKNPQSSEAQKHFSSIAATRIARITEGLK
jgi:hypothetical protein